MHNSTQASTEVVVEKSRWPDWASRMKPMEFDSSSALAEMFVCSMERNAPKILAGTAGLALERKQVAELRRSVASVATNSRTDLKFCDWFERILVAGNLDHRWQLELPTPVIALPHRKPTIVRHDMLLLSEFRTLESTLWNRLVRAQLDDEQIGFATLCVAVFWGGVVSRNRLDAVLDIEPSRVASHNGRLRVELKFQSESRSNEFWFPDALTSVFLLRGGLSAICQMRELLKDSKGKAPRFAFSKVLRGLQLPRWPHSENELLRAAKVSLTMSVPPYLCAFLSDRVRSHSLPEAALRRICKWHHITTEKDLTESDHVDKTVAFVAENQFVPEVRAVPQRERDQMAIFRLALRLLRRPNVRPDELRNLVERYQSSCWSITRHLLLWIVSRMTTSTMAPTISKSTPRRYLGTLYRQLLAVTDQEDLLQFEADDFEFLYMTASESVKAEGERAVFWARVVDFHQYLTTLGAPELTFSELDGYVGSAGGAVSANLISQNEFLQFRTAISKQISSPYICPASQSLMAAILGFHCGLRRREAQMLMLHDIHPGPSPMLIVRASRLASIKTNSSERRILLRGLVPAIELEMLMRFHAERADQLGGVRGLLFANRHSPMTPLPPDQLFDPVTKLFKAITGDQGQPFRFHHLRHSFANWTLLALLAADNPALIDSDLPFLTELSNERVTAIRATYFPRPDRAQHFVERRVLYQLSYLMGHLSPSTTLKHYVHIMDWLAGQEVELAMGRRLSGLSGPDLARLCGLSHTTPYKSPYCSLIQAPIGFLRQYVAGRSPKQWCETPAKSRDVDLTSIISQVREVGIPHPMIVIAALARRALFPEDLRANRANGISEKNLDEAEQDYLALYGKQSLLKSLMDIGPPTPPRNQADQLVF